MMNVPQGTNVRAAVVAARLLESDLEFYNVLQSSERGQLDLTGGGADQYDEPRGQLEVWWSVEIEARSWGIKDISVFVKKLVLDGRYFGVDEEGSDKETEQTFHYEYPEASESFKIGSDVDAPTPDNVYRMAKPKWTVKYEIDPYRESEGVRTMFYPEAEVDLAKHIIKIMF